MKNVVLPAWELIFQKFRRISCFFFLLVGISEIAVLPAWELIFREFARNFGDLFSKTETVKK